MKERMLNHQDFNQKQMGSRRLLLYSRNMNAKLIVRRGSGNVLTWRSKRVENKVWYICAGNEWMGEGSPRCGVELLVYGYRFAFTADEAIHNKNASGSLC